ncbi:response regulator [Hymenobacter sp. HMF4947]|uniref:histidine kinase n=1 Tax=Hymenobacter ginkgonis TaxID=2682976 RepID=A0A7K1THQ0_9BACT|nr:hybrid sensor histidine kinase/response regulator [Hymenobacter ginkgonis]MVN77938.1 response regulator [Hymenobacter ginkgonis]
MKKILLVDDNEQDRLLYKRFLKVEEGSGDERMELFEAASGEEALVMFRQVQPDCVLLDHNLHDIDGLELLAQLQKLAPHNSLCTVMITGGGSEALAVRALNSGAFDYLVKQQFDRELLRKTVRHAIEKNEWRQYQASYHKEVEATNQQLRDSLAQLTAARREVNEKNAQLEAANAEIEARNQQLSVSNQQLARTNADLDNFVYAASHDLRQPVNNLRGLFDEIQHAATFANPADAQLLYFMDKSLSALTTTITDLATLVEENRLPSTQAAEPVALADVTADILEVLHPQVVATQANIQLDFREVPEVPYVRGNLRTILLNLVANALKYRHPDRPPHVQLRSRCVAGQPVLEVQDNGLGLDLKHYGTELFQLFRRFHPQAAEGTGVGLFLVNRLVQAHGGRIEVESEEGQGTTFRVHLGPRAA